MDGTAFWRRLCNRATDGKAPENPLPPVQNPAPFQREPVTVLKFVKRGSVGEFSMSNGTRWTAPMTIKVFVQEYNSNYMYGIEPKTFNYNFVSGNMVQPFVNYSVRILKETFTLKKNVTRTH